MSFSKVSSLSRKHSTFSRRSRKIESVTLYEEYRLIEKNETEINGAWRGIHLLLFFLAFVFGSFCTFCFHMLMYLFDEKCVLFPKLISLKEIRKKNPSGVAGVSGGNKLFFDYITDDPEALPVDFVSTHWVEKSICYLPTYAPLLSGICGLIWTTMFLMCSSGSRALTGLQRPWRILPTVFVFSIAMGGLCLYTTVVTHSGLNELCSKLGKITGSNTCTYTINVATLAYERRIRGVYQATRLTIMAAWLHTSCWLGAALTALLRVILVVDFRLVKVTAELRGNIEKMLERHETHIKTDEFSNKDELNSPQEPSITGSLKVRFVNKGFGTDPLKKDKANSSKETTHFVSQVKSYPSNMSLQSEESRKLTIRLGSSYVPKKHRFIVNMLHEMVDSVDSSQKPMQKEETMSNLIIDRQQGTQKLTSLVWSPSSSSETDETVINHEEAERLAKEFRRHLERKMAFRNLSELSAATLTPIDAPNKNTLDTQSAIKLKSNLKERGVQTDDQKKKSVSQKVQITTPIPSVTSLQILKISSEDHDSNKVIETSAFSLLNSKTVFEERSPTEATLTPLTNLLSSFVSSLLVNENTIELPKFPNTQADKEKLQKEEKEQEIENFAADIEQKGPDTQESVTSQPKDEQDLSKETDAFKPKNKNLKKEKQD